MIESDVLVVSEISYQYAIAKGKISTDNENYISVKNSLIDFITNPLLSGEAYIAAKQHIMNYCSLIDYIVFQNNCEMARYDDLNELLYNLDYDEFRGDEILTAKEIAFDDLNRYGALENSYYQEYLNTPIYHPLIKWGAYDNYVYYGQLRSEAENTFNEMCRLINQFDSFVYATSNFFYVQHEWHQVALMTLVELNASVADGTYNIDRSNAALHISYGDQDNDVSSWMNGIYNNRIQSFYTTDASGNRVLNEEAIQVFFSRDPETVSQYEYETFARLISSLGLQQINDLLQYAGVNGTISRVFINCCQEYYINAITSFYMENANGMISSNSEDDAIQLASLLYYGSQYAREHACQDRHIVGINIYNQGLSVCLDVEYQDNNSLDNQNYTFTSNNWVNNSEGVVQRISDLTSRIATDSNSTIDLNGLIENGLGLLIGTLPIVDDVYSAFTLAVDTASVVNGSLSDRELVSFIERLSCLRYQVSALSMHGGVITMTSTEDDYEFLLYGTCIDYDELALRTELYNSIEGTDYTSTDIYSSLVDYNDNNHLALDFIRWYHQRGGNNRVDTYESQSSSN